MGEEHECSILAIQVSKWKGAQCVNIKMPVKLEHGCMFSLCAIKMSLQLSSITCHGAIWMVIGTWSWRPNLVLWFSSFRFSTERGAGGRVRVRPVISSPACEKMRIGSLAEQGFHIFYHDFFSPIINMIYTLGRKFKRLGNA